MTFEMDYFQTPLMLRQRRQLLWEKTAQNLTLSQRLVAHKINFNPESFVESAHRNGNGRYCFIVFYYLVMAKWRAQDRHAHFARSDHPPPNLFQHHGRRRRFAQTPPSTSAPSSSPPNPFRHGEPSTHVHHPNPVPV